MAAEPGRPTAGRRRAQRAATSSVVPGERPGTREQFRADVLELLGRLDTAACSGYLPGYLPPGADVMQMARTVRVLGEVRRGLTADEPSSDPEQWAQGGERARMYALPAERGGRAGGLQPWEQLAADYQQLVVLADPGMGKSWLIRGETHRLALAAAGSLADASVDVEEVLIPVPIRADALAAAPGRDLAEVISGYLAAEQLLPPRSVAPMRERIAAGGVVLLVDALDEVPREAAIAGGQAPGKRLQDLLRQWDDERQGTARCVLTSRLAGYSGPPLPRAREVELLPFTPQDIQTALRAWNLPDEAASRIDRLLGDPAVAGMARVPLLLALICWLAADPRYQDTLPTTRVGLYEAVLLRFLSGSHRTDYKSPAAVTVGERERLLPDLARAAFAFATTRQGWVNRMSHSALAAALGGPIGDRGMQADELIRRCEEAGVLVPAGNPSLAEQEYMFLHPTFAEYLTARHLRDLTLAQRMQFVVDHQWFDPAWAEVIPMLGGLLATHEHDRADAQALFTHFLSQWPDPLHRAFYTAIRILGDHPDPDRLPDPSQTRQLTERAISLLKQDLTYGRLLAALSTAQAWPRPLFDALLHLLRDDNRYVRSAAARRLAGQQDPAVTQALLPLLRDIDEDVRSAAAEALAARPDPAVTQALLPMLHGENSYVQSVVVREQAGRPDPAVTRALLSQLHDVDDRVRSAAARALAGQQDPAVTQALLPLLHDEVDDRVRSAAARALAGQQDPAVTQAVLPLLRDDNRWVRSAAADALAGQQDPAVVQALLPLLRDEVLVRSAAVRALAGQQDPAVTQALLPLLGDSDPFVKYEAALAQVGRRDRAVARALLPLLHDEDQDVRYAATEALASHLDPAVTQALLPLLGDDAAHVRFTAAAVLAGRSELWLLTWVTKQGRLPQTARRPAVLFALADQIADRDYLRLPPRERPRIRRRLGKLTRKAAPVPGQRRLTAAAWLRALARRAKTRLRRHPLRAAAASALAIIAGVVGSQLTGKPSLAVVAAFVVLLVAVAGLTYQAEDGADSPDTEDTHRHPR